MLDIELKVKGKWVLLENGPFPITWEQLEAARKEFHAEKAKAENLSGAKMSPQTATRDILRKINPFLCDFDVLCLGYAVSHSEVRARV